ncbi:MAG: inward rectifier potassium channel [Bradyrhizobium sp.]|jgi:inward rectifier potassium channel|nr:inward rectifier potassium channel [Bradyrhizobium sp.]
MVAQAIKYLCAGAKRFGKMTKSRSERTSKAQVVRFGGREIIITEGLHLSFWADISHRCMTASWPAFISGAALVFIAFNAFFALFYWIGNQPIANVPGGAYIDYLYFSIETLSTAGYGDMHPQTHYGHFIATVELFTGIFSMSLMTGLIFARFSRPNARLLFADHPVISSHEGKPTLMLRLANERHNVIGNATARLWLLKNIVSMEGQTLRRFYELPLMRNEHPALALSWTLYHVLDEESPLYGLNAEDLDALDVSLVVVVSGYDVVAAQTVHARRSYNHSDIRFGQRYADILGTSEDGRIRLDYGRFHDTLQE